MSLQRGGLKFVAASIGGRERTLSAADNKLTRIVPTMGPQSVIEVIAN